MRPQKLLHNRQPTCRQPLQRNTFNFKQTCVPNETNAVYGIQARLVNTLVLQGATGRRSSEAAYNKPWMVECSCSVKNRRARNVEGTA